MEAQGQANAAQVLNELIARIGGNPEGTLEGIAKKEEVTGVLSSLKNVVWVPNPGPQTQAYFSEADEIGYGGSAGSGKSDLIIGLSLTKHKRSLLLRRTNKEATRFVERYADVMGSRDGWNGQEKIWRTNDGRTIEVGGCELEDDKQKYKGNPHDLKAFDEVVDFTESQYEFIIGWNRSTDPKQKCTILATFNPPTTPIGMWVMKRWAPWLDPRHPNPAKSGEIRYFTSLDGKDTEVDGPGPYIVHGREVYAKSRTFIRGSLEDNPDLLRTNYASTLAGMPEELRAAFLEGKFDSNLKDQAYQVIPTDWVRAAFRRWSDKPKPSVPMCAIGVDASGGGNDPMVVAMRYDGWYDKLVTIPGEQIPTDRAGKFAAGIVVSHRQNKCPVVVDMGGGYGGPMFEQLKENDVDVKGHKGAEASSKRTKDNQLKFTNKRSEIIWKFREALDPSQQGGSPIALPEDPELLADLVAPTFELTSNGIRVEAKEKVCERLGRSTDKGDAVCMAWSVGPTYVTDGAMWEAEMRASRPLGRKPQVIMGRQNARRPS